MRADIDRCLSVKPTLNIPQYQYYHINIDLSVFQDSSGEDLLILAIVARFHQCKVLKEHCEAVKH